MVWDRPIQHSIRPKGQEGFLLPYYDVLNRSEEDLTLDTERFTAKAPDEHWDEFSYASELVTHDAAISALLSIERALGRMEVELGISTSSQRHWIQEQLLRLWSVRGPFPGLGSVLTAFGFSRGIFVAHALQEKVGQNSDPWPLVDAAFNSPAPVLPKDLHRDIKELAPTWKNLLQERKSLLRLLSRFELSKDQAVGLYDAGSRTKRGWGGADAEILNNPYRIYEMSRHDPKAIPLLIVDRGVFPEDTVRLKHPVESPSGLNSAVDLRRVRALTISALEAAAGNGHTLLPTDSAVEAISSFAVRPTCPATADILLTRAPDMAPEVRLLKLNGDTALQLDRYTVIGELVRKQVNGRLRGHRHIVSADWFGLLNQKFGLVKDEDEKKARIEKAAALKEVAEARFSVLAGPAGAGKTTVLGILCARVEIRDGGILLLAPTGKARVRMQQLIEGNGAKALTIAQFLIQHGRYDTSSGRYLINDRPTVTGYGTVIVDESSMLTEDMLGSLFNALHGVSRFIFVGDPAQLPPIGAGRPFVDMIAKLRPNDYEAIFPRVAPGYAELTIERRQVGAERPDLRLARWFGTTPPSAGEDDIFCSTTAAHSTLRFVEWQKPEDFQPKLAEVLKDELNLAGPDDFRGFNQALGSVASGAYDYFNATRNGNPGSVTAADSWQILSPLRGMPFGVGDINRQIHERFRAGFISLATQPWRSIPKPFGPERVVYGDKVINLSNHRRDGKRVYPQDGAIG
jgi:AAA domain